MANYMKEVNMLLGLELNKEFHIEEHSGTCRFCSYYSSCTDFGLPNCYEGRLEWLMQEHKEN